MSFVGNTSCSETNSPTLFMQLLLIILLDSAIFMAGSQRSVMTEL